MARFMCLWQSNPIAPWPADPAEYKKLLEKLFAGLDDLLKKGVVKELGVFLGGSSGYAIAEGDGATMLRIGNMVSPYFNVDPREMIAYEKAKEIMMDVVKAAIEAAKR